MDLETENRLAALLMREAAELRQQAEKEGVLAYLRQPNKRHRPNSRFLTATVLGVQQANRAVEVNEMWRVRQKELELDERREGTSRDQNSGDRRSHRDGNSSRSTGRLAMDDNSTTASASCSTKIEPDHCPEGLRDEELEMFLNSRTKRGRGAIGPRMDETGPYLPRRSDEEPIASSDVSNRRIYGPERPASLKYESSEEEEEVHVKRAKKAKTSHSEHSTKKSHSEHSKKHKSEENSRHKKKKEKRSKHRH